MAIFREAVHGKEYEDMSKELWNDVRLKPIPEEESGADLQ
jgi:hypothetical protein